MRELLSRLSSTESINRLMKYRKVILVTNGNLASMIALKDWITEYSSTIVKIYVTFQLPSSRGNVRGSLKILWQSGFQYLFLKLWINKIAPLVIRRAGHPASVAELAKRLNPDVEVRFVKSVNDPEIIEDAKNTRPDLLVSFSATHRFSDEFLALFGDAAINVHYGKLPNFAGLSPYFWHLLKKERTFGVTLHSIHSKVDSGDIVEQNTAEITTNICLSLMLDMAIQVSPMLINFFRGSTSLADARRQDQSQRSYFGHPSKKDVRQFYSDGNSMMSSAARRRVLLIASTSSDFTG